MDTGSVRRAATPATGAPSLSDHRQTASASCAGHFEKPGPGSVATPPGYRHQRAFAFGRTVRHVRITDRSHLFRPADRRRRAFLCQLLWAPGPAQRPDAPRGREGGLYPPPQLMPVDAKVIDIGCGPGLFRRHLRNAHYTGLDPYFAWATIRSSFERHSSGMPLHTRAPMTSPPPFT